MSPVGGLSSCSSTDVILELSVLVSDHCFFSTFDDLVFTDRTRHLIVGIYYLTNRNNAVQADNPPPPPIKLSNHYS